MRASTLIQVRRGIGSRSSQKALQIGSQSAGGPEGPPLHPGRS